jgi:hypothetical protein
MTVAGKIEKDTPLVSEALNARRYHHMVPRNPDAIEVQIAASPHQRDIVYKLRHDSYAAQGFIDPRPTGMFADEYDEMANSLSVLIYRHGEPVASVRASIYDRLSGDQEFCDIPAMSSFKNEINNLTLNYRGVGRPGRAIEMTRLVTQAGMEFDLDLLYSLFRITYYIVIFFNSDMILSGVRAHHIPFYRRLGFREITEPRQYPKLKFLVSLMACLSHSYKHVETTVPIIDYTSKHDRVCQEFFAGERVRVFSQMQTTKQTHNSRPKSKIMDVVP